jgi:hypothetical protein
MGCGDGFDLLFEKTNSIKKSSGAGNKALSFLFLFTR